MTNNKCANIDKEDLAMKAGEKQVSGPLGKIILSNLQRSNMSL